MQYKQILQNKQFAKLKQNNNSQYSTIIIFNKNITQLVHASIYNFVLISVYYLNTSADICIQFRSQPSL
jgi:hypothetical protein